MIGATFNWVFSNLNQCSLASLATFCSPLMPSNSSLCTCGQCHWWEKSSTFSLLENVPAILSRSSYSSSTYQSRQLASALQRAWSVPCWSAPQVAWSRVQYIKLWIYSCYLIWICIAQCAFSIVPDLTVYQISIGRRESSPQLLNRLCLFRNLH